MKATVDLENQNETLFDSSQTYVFSLLQQAVAPQGEDKGTNFKFISTNHFLGLCLSLYLHSDAIRGSPLMAFPNFDFPEIITN